MRKLIVANWKENPGTESRATKLFKDLILKTGVDVVICPPFVYLEKITAAFRSMSASKKKNLAIGAQDVFWEEKGAFTSEVGPKMIRSLGVRYVIVGHSERRKYLKETDAMINKKVKAALADGLKVILCVGEPLAVRKKGAVVAKAFIKTQLKKDLVGIKTNASVNKNLIIAYEPIWAIGSGRSDQPEDAVEMSLFIKRLYNVPFLYGGSVNSKNVADFVQYKGIDGALVGGASLKAGEFGKLIAKVAKK